jgi:glyoxylase-like metal-dependent hydrolase (beta-lactamase superfamily II)
VNPVAIHAFNPGPMTGAGNWTWLLAGRVTTLIDAGTGDPRHLHALDEALAGRPLHQVIVTHGHPDHASGAPALAARFPGVRLLKLPWLQSDGRYHVPWQALSDGDRLDAGDTSLAVLHTPGHAPDHICLWHQPSMTMFSADLAIQGSSIYIPSTHGGNLNTYLASLERVLALAPLRMFPAHGPIIEDPPALLRQYLVHRREREQQVLAALRNGLTTADAVLGRIYPGINPALSPIARDTVVAHLLKLERDGRVRRAVNSEANPEANTEAWHIIDP